MSVRRQCELLGLNRSIYYLPPAVESAENLRLMRWIDEQYLKTPFYGSRRMTACLERAGGRVNRKQVERATRREGREGPLAGRPNAGGDTGAVGRPRDAARGGRRDGWSGGGAGAPGRSTQDSGCPYGPWKRSRGWPIMRAHPRHCDRGPAQSTWTSAGGAVVVCAVRAASVARPGGRGRLPVHSASRLRPGWRSAATVSRTAFRRYVR